MQFLMVEFDFEASLMVSEDGKNADERPRRL